MVIIVIYALDNGEILRRAGEVRVYSLCLFSITDEQRKV